MRSDEYARQRRLSECAGQSGNDFNGAVTKNEKRFRLSGGVCTHAIVRCSRADSCGRIWKNRGSCHRTEVGRWRPSTSSRGCSSATASVVSSADADVRSSWHFTTRPAAKQCDGSNSRVKAFLAKFGRVLVTHSPEATATAAPVQSLARRLQMPLKAVRIPIIVRVRVIVTGKSEDHRCLLWRRGIEDNPEGVVKRRRGGIVDQ